MLRADTVSRADRLRISRKRFIVFASVFLLGYAGPMVVFLVSRSPLNADGWAFLERQRPRLTITSDGTQVAFFIVADGLNFALARRPLGGWEPVSVRLYEVLNLPAVLAAHATFNALQARPTGTSRLHSDVATAVFVAVGTVQWLVCAMLLSLRRGVNRLPG
ncbi:MAG TPA: hypothetical protein VGF48_15135 [Thermoanaerobaculia bacterium]|jgi:hypothetical protein